MSCLTTFFLQGLSGSWDVDCEARAYGGCWVGGRVACRPEGLYSPAVTGRRLCCGCQFSRLSQAKNALSRKVEVMVRRPSRKYCPGHMAVPAAPAWQESVTCSQGVGPLFFLLFFPDETGYPVAQDGPVAEDDLESLIFLSSLMGL